MPGIPDKWNLYASMTSNTGVGVPQESQAPTWSCPNGLKPIKLLTITISYCDPKDPIANIKVTQSPGLQVSRFPAPLPCPPPHSFQSSGALPPLPPGFPSSNSHSPPSSSSMSSADIDSIGSSLSPSYLPSASGATDKNFFNPAPSSACASAHDPVTSPGLAHGGHDLV